MNVEELFRPFSPPETNLLERLRYWAAAMPDRTAYRFLEAGELDNPAELTYAQLDKKARAIAAYLVAQGYAGKRAIMLYDPGLDFLAAFLGCHYAAVTPIPAYPPRRNRNMNRINSISIDAEAAVALTTQTIIKRCEDFVKDSPGLQRIPWLATEAIDPQYADDWVKPNLKPDDLGPVSYTHLTLPTIYSV